MAAGDIIAIYAAIVSTVAAAVAWRTWSRAPSSRIELRSVTVSRRKDEQGDEEGILVSVIAANRSPHDVVITDGVLRLRVGTDEPIGAGVETVEEHRREVSASIRMFGISLEATKTVLMLLIEAPLLPINDQFPLPIKTGQGAELHAVVPAVRQTYGRATVEVRTNDGLAFSADAELE